MDGLIRYDSPGKAKARDLVVAVAAAECQTALDFYGGGRSAIALAEAGLQVISAEMNRDLYEQLARHASLHGFTPFYGRASRVDGTFDFVFADFDGGPSPRTRRELQKLAAKADKWLAVTLAPDHQLDEAVVGPSSAATVPAWLIEATGMRLEYIGRYVRNEYRQWMWIALLRPRQRRRGSAQQLDVLTIARDLQRRRYWASDAFRAGFSALVPHRKRSASDAVLARRRVYYQENRARYREQGRASYYANRDLRLSQQKAWRKANPEKYEASQKRWREAHPDYRQEERRTYRRAYYLANREKAIEQARLWRERQRELKKAA